ncbi:MAG: hypothetical protein Q7S27_04600 [Nanoarchaeota archaeon]|nr:hypothetical protein [Nanoarchaeota archaeon]
MGHKINFPNIEKGVNLCFVRKYRNSGKTHYIFYKASIKNKVSLILKDWLINQINKINNKDYPDYTLTNFENPEYISLEEINVWKDFKEKAFSIDTQEDEILSKIKNQLTAFIIYSKKGKEIIGYTRKISSSNVLTKKGLFSLLLDDSSFNELIEQEGVEIDKYADLIFKISEIKDEGIILNKYDFNGTFDIIEQQRNEALEIVRKDPVIKNNPSFQMVESEISKNRTFQKMLLNPVVNKNLEMVDYEYLKKAKNNLGFEITYDLDEKNKTIIFPQGKEKESIHSYLKVKGHKYQKTIDDKHYLESNPERVIK